MTSKLLKLDIQQHVVSILKSLTLIHKHHTHITYTSVLHHDEEVC